MDARSYLVQPVEHGNCRFPVNTRIGDADAVLEGTRAFWRDVLPACVDMRLQHDTRERGVTRSDLVRKGRQDLRLVVMVLLRIAVCVRTASISAMATRRAWHGTGTRRTTAIDHDTRVIVWACLFHGGGGGVNVLRRVVRAS